MIYTVLHSMGVVGSTLLHWFPWLAGGGVLVWAALAVFAPSALTVASSWLVAMSPLVRGASDLIVAFFTAIVNGARDMLDNLSSIVFVVTVAALASWWVTHTKFCTVAAKPVSCEKCITELRKNFTFVPKHPVKLSKPVADTSAPWFGFFQ